VNSLTVLMPVFNERRTVAEAIDRVLAAELPVGERELIVIDDGSTDGTGELLRDGDWPDSVRVLTHAANSGKGAALRTGLAQASGAYTTIMDADLEYDPAEIADLIPALDAGVADAVFGVRGFAAHNSFSFWYVLGNRFVTFVANLLYNCYLADLMTCHKAIRTDMFRSLPLREPGFAIEPEITATLIRRGARIYEVPVTYRARRREEGKKLTAVDGFRVLRTLVRCRLDSAPPAAGQTGAGASGAGP
jgi:glycosyltransferase involved in cell wall biosynthesis